MTSRVILHKFKKGASNFSMKDGTNCRKTTVGLTRWKVEQRGRENTTKIYWQHKMDFGRSVIGSCMFTLLES